jgi:hypothetical protein
MKIKIGDIVMIKKGKRSHSDQTCKRGCRRKPLAFGEKAKKLVGKL